MGGNGSEKWSHLNADPSACGLEIHACHCPAIALVICQTQGRPSRVLPGLFCTVMSSFGHTKFSGGWYFEATARASHCICELLFPSSLPFHPNRTKLLSCPESSSSLGVSESCTAFSRTLPAAHTSVLHGPVSETHWQDVYDQRENILCQKKTWIVFLPLSLINHVTRGPDCPGLCVPHL